MEGTANRRKRNEGRLDHPARAADRVRFSPDFGRRAIVFVDTEEEFDWGRPRSRAHTETSAIKHLPEFQKLMEAHGYRPCYLIDYPVADNAPSAAIMAGLVSEGRCDIGTQLHPWVNPPFDEDVTTINSFAGNLPFDLERAKLLALTNRIEAAVGVRPIAYRAGRYGVGANTARILEESGYQLDSSVRPYFDYSHEGGPDFSGHDARPYWTGPNGTLVELPLGVAFTGGLRRYGRLLSRGASLRRRSALARFGLAARVALTPEDMPFEDVRRAILAMLSDGIQILSISFHSPSLAPGHTPYVRNSAQLNEFYGWWDKVLALLQQEGVMPVSVGEIVDAAWGARKA